MITPNVKTKNNRRYRSFEFIIARWKREKEGKISKLIYLKFHYHSLNGMHDLAYKYCDWVPTEVVLLSYFLESLQSVLYINLYYNIPSIIHCPGESRLGHGQTIHSAYMHSSNIITYLIYILKHDYFYPCWCARSSFSFIMIDNAARLGRYLHARSHRIRCAKFWSTYACMHILNEWYEAWFLQ